MAPIVRQQMPIGRDDRSTISASGIAQRTRRRGELVGLEHQLGASRQADDQSLDSSPIACCR